MDVVRAINPFARINSENQALTAVRCASLALVLGAAAAVVFGVIMMTSGGDALRIVSQAVADELDLAGRGRMIADLTVATMFGFAVFQLLLGVYHWRHPGTIIPIIALIVVAWGLIQGILPLTGMTGEATPISPPTVFKIVLMAFQVILFAAAMRGANALDRYRGGGAK